MGLATSVGLGIWWSESFGHRATMRWLPTFLATAIEPLIDDDLPTLSRLICSSRATTVELGWVFGTIFSNRG